MFGIPFPHFFARIKIDALEVCRSMTGVPIRNIEIAVNINTASKFILNFRFEPFLHRLIIRKIYHRSAIAVCSRYENTVPHDNGIGRIGTKIPHRNAEIPFTPVHVKLGGRARQLVPVPGVRLVRELAVELPPETNE